MLAASLQLETIFRIFSPNIIGYVLLMMFIVRPLSIFLSTINSGLTLQEKTLVGWIEPRGIVALTVSSYFADILEDAGYLDASIITDLTFSIVIFIVVGYSIVISSFIIHLYFLFYCTSEFVLIIFIICFYI